MVAIAPNYRGQRDDLSAKPLPRSRGWRVAELRSDAKTLETVFAELAERPALEAQP